MASNRTRALPDRRHRRVWRFEDACFDETRWALTVAGRPVSLETKPLAVLHELLVASGEVLGKNDLLDAVWPDDPDLVGEASLASAVSKLRRALCEPAAARIQTVPKIGYRLSGPVAVDHLSDQTPGRLVLAAGQPVPHRPQWTLVEPLAGPPDRDRWRATNPQTGESRVFSFAETPDGLRVLRREVAVALRLADGQQATSAFVPVVERWFDAPPFVVEALDGGTTLREWASGRGGLEAIPIGERVAVIAAAARATAIAHGMGVLHGELSPDSVLVDRNGTVRLFGLRDTLPDAAPATEDRAPDGSAGEAEPLPSLYRAPELWGGGRVTVQIDLFALGVLLYQMVAADFGRALVPGWEADVPNPLVAEDISAAAHGDPARRLSAAGLLAERLEGLADRQQARLRRQRQDSEARLAAEHERRRRARAPWVRAATVALLAGMAGTTIAAVTAWRARVVAVAERRTATAAYDFLSRDLLGRVSPGRADAAAETLTEAVLRAGGDIDRRFADQPRLAARLHHSLAGALHQRSLWKEARRSYRLADRAFARAGAATDADAVENRLSLATTEVASAQPGSLERAKTLVAAERRRSGSALADGAAAVKLAQVEGLIAYYTEPATAPAYFERAARLAGGLPDRFSPAERLQLRQAAAMARLRGGDVAGAAPILARVADRLATLEGPNHPDVLLARGSALTAQELLGHHAEVAAAAPELLAGMERRFGRDHRFTLSMRSLLADALVALGRYAEAERNVREVLELALAREGGGQQAQIARLDLAQILCRDDRASEGERVARAARAEVLEGSGSDYPLAHVASFMLGECLTAAGLPSRALRIFRRVDPERVGQQLADPNWAPTLHLALADALLETGDRGRASVELNKVSGHFNTAGSDPFQRARARRISRALTQLQ